MKRVVDRIIGYCGRVMDGRRVRVGKKCAYGALELEISIFHQDFWKYLLRVIFKAFDVL